MHFYLKDWAFSVRGRHFSGLTSLSYLVDWLFYLMILIVFIVYGSLSAPRYHEFSLMDLSIRYTYKVERETAVPLLPLILIAIIFPILQFFVCTFLGARPLSRTRKAWDIHTGVLCLFGGISTQLMITCILKNICGLPRPDLISRCIPDPDTEIDLDLVTVNVCTNSDISILREGFRSFPSGHSSTVFCGMVIASLNISGKLQVFDKRGISFKVVLAIFPIMIACFVACSRISDNRHFLRDVIGGSIIGCNVGLWFYLQYFPSVFDLKNCGRAYPPRRIGVANFFGNVGGFWKLTDKLPGAFEARSLNSPSALKELTSLSVFKSNASLSEQPDLTSVPNNIGIANQISRILGNKYINLDNSEVLE